MEAGLEDMTAHFLPRNRRWGRERRTWSMVREGKAIRSRTDYLLGTDRSLFRNVAVQDPRYNSYHYMVVGLLQGGTTREHIRYIAGWRRIPLTPPREPTREDTLFGDLRRAVPKPHMREQHRNAWISEERVLPRGFPWQCQRHPSPPCDVSDVFPCCPPPVAVPPPCSGTSYIVGLGRPRS